MLGGRHISANHPGVQTLKRWWAQETGRLILWVPVLMIVGISIYFSLPTEPDRWRPVFAMVLAVVIWARGRRARFALGAAAGKILFFVLIGFVLAQTRAHTVAAPIIPHETVPVRIEGHLLKIEQRPTSQRLLIAPSKIGGLAAENLPKRIRLTWRGEGSTARPGDVVALRGVVSPPPMPTMPGGFDYGRQLFFEQIGGVGFAVSQPRPVWVPEKRPFSAWVEDVRATIAERIMDQASPRAAPVLAAVVTGLRAQIPDETTDQLRDTGLAHLLAISGLHMGLVCGFLFLGMRTILVYIPGLAARYPVKKWAAVAAILGGTVYLTLSGAAWSAQRAYIVAIISFVAILFDRRAISMRNVAIAAVIILSLKPEAALSAGFQMSFGAVMALVAAYEAWERWRRQRVQLGRTWAPIRFVGGVSFTSLIAGGATAPFAIYHFGRIANYGLVANLAVMPLFTIGVMPIAVLGLLAMPFGLDAPFWWISSRAFDSLLFITEKIADWRGAVLLVPQWPVSAWLSIVAGMIVTCLAAAPWRLVGALALPIGLGLAALHPQPTLIVGEEGRNILFRDPGTQEIQFLNRRRERFAAETWIEAYGHAPTLRNVDVFGPCTEQPCMFATEAGNIVVATTEPAALRACRNAVLTITPAWTDGRLQDQCARSSIAAEDMASEGPVSIYIKGDTVTMESVRTKRANRLWGNSGRSIMTMPVLPRTAHSSRISRLRLSNYRAAVGS